MTDTILDPAPNPQGNDKNDPGTIKAPTSWVETRNEPLPPQTDVTMIAAASIEEFPEEVRPFVQDPNRQINQYILSTVLGKGGMGEVWKAWDRKLSRWAAIKFLLGQSQEGVARFKREAKMAARLTHPNIAPVHEVGEAPSRQPGQPSCHFLAMEYIDGCTLGSAKLSMRDRIDVFAKVAQGLEAAHKAGIVHRDIKPANIMLTKENWPYLMDFGLAKSIDGDNNLSATGAVMGTPAFMPPEQVEGLADQIGTWSDVYSLGATMYAVFCGVHPFTAQTTLQLLQKVCNESPQPPRAKNPEISTELEAIILKAMAKKKDDRYQTAAAVSDALKRVLLRIDSGAAAAAEAPPVAPPVSKAKPASIWPIFLVLFLLAGGSAAAGTGVWWFVFRKPRTDLVVVDPKKNPTVVTPIKVDPKPEVKPELKPEVTPELIPAVKPETKPELKPEVKPELKPLVVPETRPEVKPELKPVVVPELKPEVKPELKPEATPEVKPELKPIVVPDVKPVVVPDDPVKRGFDYLGGRYRSAELAADSDYWAALAALRANPPPIARGKILTFLKSAAWEQSARTTTSAALRTIGLALCGDPEARGMTAQGAHYLVNAQGKNGLWADGPKVAMAAFEPLMEPEGALLVSGDPAPRRFIIAKGSIDGPDGDLAATPLALLALYAAQACGHQVPADTWKHALDGIEGKGGKDATSLYLCRLALGDSNPGQNAAIQDAVKALVESKDRSLAPWSAIEQIGSLLATPRLGDLEWAGAGMQALTAMQQPDGSWLDDNDPARGTGKALLFLTKSTAAIKALSKPGGMGRLEMKSLGGCPNIMFVLDASGRMRQELGDKERFDVAKETIARIVEKLPENAIVGLRVFGNRFLAVEPGAETDTFLVVPPGPVNKRQMIGHMTALKVKGRSLLTFTLIQTMEDLRHLPGNDEMAVVLMIDGNDADRRADAA
ncbi:MAG TPA: protein kinase, partial [Planctomycetota bacterium]|nr:protein kinase [Planctomycetota bacterium]